MSRKAINLTDDAHIDAWQNARDAVEADADAGRVAVRTSKRSDRIPDSEILRVLAEACTGRTKPEPADAELATDGGHQLQQVPFNDWSRERLAAGDKTATTRTSRYGRPGDRFEVEGSIYELTHVLKLPLVIVAEHFYEQEGCEESAEFVEIWEDIHPRKGFEPDWEVWLHLFREVETR